MYWHACDIIATHKHVSLLQYEAITPEVLLSRERCCIEGVTPLQFLVEILG